MLLLVKFVFSICAENAICLAQKTFLTPSALSTKTTICANTKVPKDETFWNFLICKANILFFFYVLFSPHLRCSNWFICCLEMPYFSHSIARSKRRNVSSLPKISAISLAPPGVAARPVKAMRAGHKILPFLTPNSCAKATKL